MHKRAMRRLMLRLTALATLALLVLCSGELPSETEQPPQQLQQCVAEKTLPVIDVSSLTRLRTLLAGTEASAAELEDAEATSRATAQDIYDACTTAGFFYVTNHGVPEELQEALAEASREFFALPLEVKREISMQKGGKAWRGYFAPGEELTKGIPDGKEGVYFGEELAPDHPKVQAGTPMHGANLYPDDSVPRLRPLVEAYMHEVQKLGEAIIQGVSLSLGLSPTYLRDRFMSEPVTLFRIFHYPANWTQSPWGVGEHNDYGVLTMLKQDDIGGLEVRDLDGNWIKAPPLPGTFVVNIGDMLEKMSGGLFRSTPHRATNPSSTRGRLSFPFFYDPSWDVEPYAVDEVVRASIRLRAAEDSVSRARSPQERWDGLSVDDLRGTYGELLMRRVSKVFPQLAADNLAQ